MQSDPGSPASSLRAPVCPAGPRLTPMSDLQPALPPAGTPFPTLTHAVLPKTLTKAAPPQRGLSMPRGQRSSAEGPTVGGENHVDARTAPTSRSPRLHQVLVQPLPGDEGPWPVLSCHGSEQEESPRGPARAFPRVCKPCLAWGGLRPRTLPGGPQRAAPVFSVPRWNVGPQDVDFAVGMMKPRGTGVRAPIQADLPRCVSEPCTQWAFRHSHCTRS